MLYWSNNIKEKIESLENKENIDVFYFPDSISFSTMDGTLSFIITSINYILEYGNKNLETKKYLRKIRGLLSKLYLENTLYEPNSYFDDYKVRMSKLISLNINKDIINQNTGHFGKWVLYKENLIVILRTKHVRGKENLNTPEFERFEDYVEYAILNQLDVMRLNNETKQPLISEYGCHIEIVVAINYLINATRYLFRCGGSTRKGGLFFSDIIEINGLLSLVETTLKRIKHIKI